jgi:hypothetical protein
MKYKLKKDLKKGDVGNKDYIKKVKVPGGYRVYFYCDNCQNRSHDKLSHYKNKKRHFCCVDCYHSFLREKLPKEESGGFIHGLYDLPEYATWKSMVARCHKDTNNSKNYKKRGITVCIEWRKDFYKFYEDMGKRPEGTSLDRVDNNKGYCKANCRWATPYEQANNKRNNKYITFKGKTLSLSQWSRELGISRGTLAGRLARSNGNVEVSFGRPVDTRFQNSRRRKN